MKITVYLGTGGVGKTSVSAAAALSSAQRGIKALVLTTDPAQRLRTALGLKPGLLEEEVDIQHPSDGELWAALLDVRATLNEAVRLYAKPGMEPRILAHPIYETIASSLAGMQELMAVERIDQLIRRGFHHIVLDTAPSRHAFELLDKPALFADFSGSKKVKLVGRTYRFAAGMGLGGIGKGALDIFGKVESILGVNLVRQILDFYSIFFPIAEGYAERAAKTVALLRDPGITEFRVVTTPQKARRDAAFYTEALAERKFALGVICINRAWQHAVPGELPGGLEGEVLAWYRAVSESQKAAVKDVEMRFSHRVRTLQVLPELERDVDGLPALQRLADELARQEASPRGATAWA